MCFIVVSVSTDAENIAEELPEKLEEQLLRDDKNIISSVEWSHKMTLLLLELYRIHLDEFKNNKIRKKTIWGQIALGLEEAGYGSLTWRACAKKFYNLRSTYQGMMDSNRKTGCKKWPYYDLFYNLFGLSASAAQGGDDDDSTPPRTVKRRRRSGLGVESGDADQLTNRPNKRSRGEIQQVSWLTDIMTGETTAIGVETQLKLIENTDDEIPGQVQEAEVVDDRSSGPTVEWTHNLTMILLELYQAHVDDFRNDKIRKKSVWARIASGIQSAGYANMTWEVCEKKFRNLKCTYRTIVENKKSERGRTKWPYYEIFHELFGSSQSLDAGRVELTDIRNESGLEMECNSVSATFVSSEVDKDYLEKSPAGLRKRKVMQTRSWITDFMSETPKLEETKSIDDINEELLHRTRDSELIDDENVGSAVEWTRNVTLLLLELYQNHFNDFENPKIMKKTVWGEIASGIQAAGFGNMTWDVCEKKFRNLKSTYRTIMENGRSTGQVRTKWPYFEYFHNLFGNQPTVSVIEIGGDSVILKSDISQNESSLQMECSSTAQNGKEMTNTSEVPKVRSVEPTLTWLADFMTETQKAMDARLKFLENRNDDSLSKSQDIELVESRNAKSAFEWTHNMTLALLELYQVHLDDFKNGNMRKKNVWGRIASGLQSSGFGNNVTWDVCEKKFRNLKCTYWTIVESNRRTGRVRKKWPYYEHFHELFGSSPAAHMHRFESGDDSDSPKRKCLSPPLWLTDFMTEMQKAEDSRMKFLEQMHAEQKQQAAEHVSALHELSNNIRLLIDKLSTG